MGFATSFARRLRSASPWNVHASTRMPLLDVLSASSRVAAGRASRSSARSSAESSSGVSGDGSEGT